MFKAKYIIVALAICTIQPVFADAYGPDIMCYQELSNRWDILSLRNSGLPLSVFEERIQAAPTTDEQKAEKLAFVREVYQAPGDGWEWVNAKLKACRNCMLFGTCE